MPGEDAGAWRQRRGEAAEARAAAAERERRREHDRARELLAGFVAELQRLGVAPVDLHAVAGGARYRTGLRGWYLKRDGSLAVTTDGEYYVTTVAPSVRGRLLGVRLLPSDPPLQVGRGARDGESVELVVLLRQRLAEAGGEGSGPAVR